VHIVHVPPTVDARKPLSEELAKSVPQTIVFGNSAERVEMLYRYIKRALPKLKIATLHKNLSVDERLEALTAFHQMKCTILIATDLAARGLDTRTAKHVIQADFANDVASYMHRTGRIGRAGDSGLITSLVRRTNLPLAQEIIKARTATDTVDAAFSRKRSFRRTVLRQQRTAAEEVGIMKALEAEHSSLLAENGGQRTELQ
jgi:superfamily II DNA/RNA helicase